MCRTVTPIDAAISERCSHVSWNNNAALQINSSRSLRHVLLLENQSLISHIHRHSRSSIDSTDYTTVLYCIRNISSCLCIKNGYDHTSHEWPCDAVNSPSVWIQQHETTALAWRPFTFTFTAVCDVCCIFTDIGLREVFNDRNDPWRSWRSSAMKLLEK